MSTTGKEIFDEAPKDALPFAPERQAAVIGHCLSDKGFFLQCVDRIQPEWFVETLNQVLWTTMKLMWTDFRDRIPLPYNPKEILCQPIIEQESMGRKKQLETQLNICATCAVTYSRETITVELTGWYKSRLYQEGMYRSRDAYNRKQTADAYRVLEDTTHKLRDASFNSEVTYNFDDIRGIVEQREQNAQNALTWGLTKFDELLLPEGKGKGSLLPAATTTIVGPINAGKTTVMMTVGCANLKQGKKVLYIPHEGIETELRAKWLCCMLKCDLAWLTAWSKKLDLPPGDLTMDEQRVVAHIKGAQGFLKNLTFMPMIQQGLECEAVFGSIRRKNDEVAAGNGQGYHLVIDDYPAKTTTELARGGKLEYRHRIEAVYMGHNRLAEELGYHHLNGAQVTREGNKINKGFKGFEKRLLEMEDFQESFGPMADTATVITLNRDPIAEAQDRVTMHCAKSRTGKKGWSVVCRSRYGNSISHSDSLGCTYYYGSAQGTERLNTLIDLFRNQQIPVDEEM